MFDLIVQLEMKEKQEGGIMRKSKGKEEAERKEVEKEQMNAAEENIFNIGPLDGDIM